MDKLETIFAIFEAREEIYLEFTKQVWDLIPQVRKAIDESIKQETPQMYPGISWALQDMGMLSDALLIKVNVKVAHGEYDNDGETITVTAENEAYFNLSLNYAIPLDMVAVDDYEVILSFINERIAEAGQIMKQQNHKPTIIGGFDVSELTPEQRLAFELHTKTNQ